MKSRHYLLICLAIAIVGSGITFQEKIILFRVTDQNPGSNSYTLRGIFDNTFSQIPKIPGFELRGRLDIVDALSNYWAFVVFTCTTLVILPFGILYILYIEVAVVPFPENLFQYKAGLFAYVIYTVVSPFFFWVYLLLQTSTIMYKVIWLLPMGTLLFGIFLLLKRISDKPIEPPEADKQKPMAC